MKISKFQIAVLGIFVLCIIVGVASFALYRGSSNTTTLSSISIWGIFPADTFDLYLAEINATRDEPIVVNYVQKRADSFSQEFIAALARGQGPDAILVPADILLPHYDKLAMVPFSALPQRTFMDSYIQEANIYLNAGGIIALPFTVDPLVLYWNRDMFNAAGIATYPRYWDEFTGLNTKLTTKDKNGNIRKSAIALGDFTNVTNAREILGALWLQSGNPVTAPNDQGVVQSTIHSISSADPVPAVSFFTKFSDPSNADYSWNHGMPSSKAAFLSGTVATYIGFASELADLRLKNPNLNFDVAALPQLRTGGKKATYGRLTGFSIVRTAADANSTYQIMSILTSPTNLASLNQKLYLPTVRRDVIAQGSTDPYITIFNEAALIAKTWIDADPSKSRDIFSRMIQSVTSGAKSTFQALQDAADEYDVVLRQAVQ